MSRVEMPRKPSTERPKDSVPHIRYESPYDGHPILRKKGSDAYAAVVSFLRHCTDWDGTWPDNEVQGRAAGEFIRPDDCKDKMIAEFARAIGKSRMSNKRRAGLVERS